MPDILIRDVSQPVLDRLKERAGRNRRSLQQELLSILDSVASAPPDRSPIEIADAIRTRLEQSGRTFTDSTPLIREDRER